VLMGWEEGQDNGGAEFHYFAKRTLREMAKDMNLHRIQATVVQGNKKSARWLRTLGFKQEGRLRSFDKEKNDHELYSVIRGLDF